MGPSKLFRIRLNQWRGNLRGFRDKLLYLVLFSSYSSLFLILEKTKKKRRKNLKNFDPKSSEPFWNIAGLIDRGIFLLLGHIVNTTISIIFVFHAKRTNKNSRIPFYLWKFVLPVSEVPWKITSRAILLKRTEYKIKALFNISTTSYESRCHYRFDSR